MTFLQQCLVIRHLPPLTMDLRNIVLSYYRTIIPSYYHTIVLSYYHTIIPYTITLSHYHIILSYDRTVILSYYHTIILVYYHTILYYHTIILLIPYIIRSYSHKWLCTSLADKKLYSALRHCFCAAWLNIPLRINPLNLNAFTTGSPFF